MQSWFEEYETLTMSKTKNLNNLADADLRLLKIFHGVVAAGGVSAAEVDLNIGRSTISRYLTDLESRLGVKLCHRGPSGFSMTEEGQLIYNASLLLFAAVNDFQANVDEIHQHLTGAISIAMFDRTSSNPVAHVPESIRMFDEIAPDVRINVSIEALNEIETGVLNGRIQVGIVPVHKKNENLEYFPLYSEQMYLYCAKGHPLFDVNDKSIKDEDIRASKYAGFNFETPGTITSRKWQIDRSADVNYEEALMPLILSGCYIGILPDHYARRFIDAGEMRPLCPDRFHYQVDFSAIVRKIPKMSRRVDCFIDCLQQAHC